MVAKSPDAIASIDFPSALSSGPLWHGSHSWLFLGASAAQAVDYGCSFDPGQDTASVSGTLHDLTRVEAEAKGEYLLIVLQFAYPVSGADSGTANALRGYIDFDIDRNALPGWEAYSEYLGMATAGIGVDGWVNLETFSCYTNKIGVYNANGQPTGQADVVFAPANRVEVKIPLTALGGGNGDVDISVVVSNSQYQWTEAAPNQSAVRSIGKHQVFVSDRMLVEAWVKHLGTKIDATPQFVTEGPSSAWSIYDPSFLELVVSVLDACQVNGYYWVFSALQSDLEFDLKVTDTVSGNTAAYHKAPYVFQLPINDQSALPCS